MAAGRWRGRAAIVDDWTREAPPGMDARRMIHRERGIPAPANEFAAPET
jgi:hypothetical protein